MKRRRLVSMVGLILMIIGTVFMTSGCLMRRALRGYSLFAKQDTSVTWQMETLNWSWKYLQRPRDKVKKLSNWSKLVASICMYADRNGADYKVWYKFTAPEKPGEVYYAMKTLTSKGALWWAVYQDIEGLEQTEPAESTEPVEPSESAKPTEQ